MNRISQKLGYHFEVPVFQVDDNNVIAVYDVTREANRNCRSGKDPVFIEFLTYQLRGHLGQTITYTAAIQTHVQIKK